MAGSLTVTIPATTVPNDGVPHVLSLQTFPAITQVTVNAGQDLSQANFTLRTATAPSSYLSPGTLAVFAITPSGNSFPVTITYTGTNGQGFTGCNVTSGVNTLTTLARLAEPQLSGQITLNRTGTGNHPWLNTLDSSTEFDIAIQSSDNGGQTWQDESATSTVGGPLIVKGQVVTTLGLSVGPINPAAGQVRLLATVPVSSTSPVWTGGSATVTTR